MESERRTQTDRELDELGDAPANLPSLIERCVGRTRIGVEDADVMLANLSVHRDGTSQERIGSDSKDGPLTRRMDAREARKSVPLGKSRFSDGLPGADDLPVFPPRSPIPAKAFVPEHAAVAVGPDEETSDGFEILVDEELLEIEPDES